jgi:hypothetical protein
LVLAEQLPSPAVQAQARTAEVELSNRIDAKIRALLDIDPLFAGPISCMCKAYGRIGANSIGAA